MASLLFTLLSSLLGAGINATAFAGASLGFSMLRDDGGKERKKHDLAVEKLQKTKDEWNKNQMKRLDFINKRLCNKNEERAYINNVDEAMLEYFQLFAKQIKPLPPEPQLSDFYHLSNCELLIDAVDTGIATYALCKYLK